MYASNPQPSTHPGSALTHWATLKPAMVSQILSKVTVKQCRTWILLDVLAFQIQASVFFLPQEGDRLTVLAIRTDINEIFRNDDSGSKYSSWYFLDVPDSSGTLPFVHPKIKPRGLWLQWNLLCYVSSLLLPIFNFPIFFAENYVCMHGN